MEEKKRKRIRVHKTDQKTAAGNRQEISGGHYYCDYSPRYEKSFDIYEKAREHSRKIRKRMEEK